MQLYVGRSLAIALFVIKSEYWNWYHFIDHDLTTVTTINKTSKCSADQYSPYLQDSFDLPPLHNQTSRE